MASLQNSNKNISPEVCNKTVTKLFDKVSTSLVNVDVTSDNLYNLLYFCSKGFEAEEDEKYSIPMVWIGVYMAVASFFCILCMVADSLLVRKERYQIPSKYFSLNTTSMMVIAIAMKLTVDLSGSMPGNLDQMTKIGSIAFMCTIMAILNPSLASMDNKTLFSNIIGLAIFVITIAVNLLIQIGTGVIRDQGPKVHISTDNDQWKVNEIVYSFDFVYVACVYIGIMLFLLLISISTAIIIPSFKEVLESKYQMKRKDLNEPQYISRIPKVEELTHYVTRYWVMAKSGSPQFFMACNLLSYTSLLLCVTGMCLYVYMLTSLREGNAYDGNFESDYGWSLSVILWTQVTGNVIGTVILVSRGFTSMKFKVHDILRSKDFRIFIVRKHKYWTQRLYEWQGSHSHLGFLSSHSIRCHPVRSRIFIHHTKKVVLSLCILLQLAFVQFNQLILSPFIFIMRCIIKFEDGSGCRLCTTSTTTSDDPFAVQKKKNDDDNLKIYVLQLEDDVEPSQRVVETISKSMDRLIERARKKENNDLLELLGKSNAFKGLEILDDIDPLPPSVKLNSWSVPVITLTCIAIAVPDISGKEQVRSLIGSIDEALLYTQHVEKSFNSAREYGNISKTAMTLWDDVIRVRKCRWLENPIGEGVCGQLIIPKSRWLGNPIGGGACGQLPRDILTWFAAKAQPILKEEPASLKKEEPAKETTIDFPDYKLIAARLMHHITSSISSKYQADDEIQTNKERFFELLCSMIADMLVACFSNIPQVIMMKCHTDEIEKREASVAAAVKLLGKSTEIIRKLEACTLPNMDPEKRASIHEWLNHLKQLSIP